jgi:MSHA biogenesis protein MshO
MRRTVPDPRPAQAGFTMVEAVVAMVLIGIVAGVVAVFIRIPMVGYSDSLARAEVADVADNALRQVARDVRLALPNSVRVSGNFVEMLQTRTGGRYLSVDDGDSVNPELDFVRAGQLTFTAIGDLPTGRQAIRTTDRVVVNNLGSGFVPGDAYDLTNGRNSAAITSVGAQNGGIYTITMASNPFAGQDPSLPSPSSRFHIVTGPVTYQCITSTDGTGSLRRHSGYTLAAAQPTSFADAGALVANNVVDCGFTYVALNARAALLVMNLSLRVPGSSDDQPVALVHQVHF